MKITSMECREICCAVMLKPLMLFKQFDNNLFETLTISHVHTLVFPYSDIYNI